MAWHCPAFKRRHADARWRPYSALSGEPHNIRRSGQTEIEDDAVAASPPMTRSTRDLSAGGALFVPLGVDIERPRFAFDHIRPDDDLLDAVEAGQIEHGIEQDRLP